MFAIPPWPLTKATSFLTVLSPPDSCFIYLFPPGKIFFKGVLAPLKILKQRNRKVNSYYFGDNRLFQLTKSALAMNIEEYTPKNTPTRIAKEKNLVVSPPKKNNAAITKSTVSEVFIERVIVERMLHSTVFSKDSFT